MSERYDVLIIGGGQGGIPLSFALARAGKKVAVAERKNLGGSCVNFGCTPSKAAIASARVAHLARRAADYGLVIPIVDVDFSKVLERAASLAASSREYLTESLTSSGNPRLLKGHAHFTGRLGEDFRVAIDGEEVNAEQVVLDTGTRSALPPIEGAKDVDFIDSENWLNHRKLPQQLLIIGGGYIGLEMSQFYRRMGAHVTVVEHSEQVAGQEDRDVATALQQLLEEEGIQFHLSAKVTRLQQTSRGVAVTIETRASGAYDIEVDTVFLALGRQPNTDDLGLDRVGVSWTKQGTIPVDKRLATGTPGVWAMGDIRGGPMFTHTAWDDYRIVESQLIGDGSRTLERIVPYAIFTDPELGRVGLTEREAREQGYNVRTGHFDMARNGKAKELGETRGFIKVVIDSESERLLGAAIISTEAAELVHLYVELMNANAPYSIMERAIHIHPTLAEATQSAIAALH